MKQTIIIGVITVVILALLFAVKAFTFVFVTVLHYGIYALILALLIYVVVKTFKRKDDE